MVFEPHLSPDELTVYCLGSCSDRRLEKLEEHLLYCERCREKLVLTCQRIQPSKTAVDAPGIMKRIQSIHMTEDGPVFGALHKSVTGKWKARHWGRQLDGGRVFDSVEEANEYLTESFAQMFPDHECSGECRK